MKRKDREGEHLPAVIFAIFFLQIGEEELE